jgi:hypothetical protein
MNWLKQHYGMTEGPLGFPLTDKQALALDAILKSLPKDSAYSYRKMVVGDGSASGVSDDPGIGAFSRSAQTVSVGENGLRTPAKSPARHQFKAVTEVSSGERSDVSWISTEDPDRVGDVVCAKGMNDGQFRLNPIVTLNHCYSMPPVGRSLWRKLVKDGPLRGIKAKTLYPPRPAAWAEGKDWPADVAFSLVQADLLRGKSIGFLPVKVHVPDAQEKRQRLDDRGPAETANGARSEINLVIDEWILLEYACVVLPAQQNAVVESVSKSQQARTEFSTASSTMLASNIGAEKIPALPAEFQKALGLIYPSCSFPGSPGADASGSERSPLMPFTSLAEIEKAIQDHIRRIDVQKLIQARLDLLRGRI